MKRRRVKEGKHKFKNTNTGPFRIITDFDYGHFIPRNLRNLQETNVNGDHIMLVPEPAALVELLQL